MMMLFAALMLAILSWALVVIGGFGNSLAVGSIAIAASLVGLALLMVERMRSRKATDAQTDPDGPVRLDAHHPDYAASAHPPQDAMIHDDHEVERHVSREEDTIYSDNGPRSYDVSRRRAAETIGETHFRAGRDRGPRH